MPSSSLHPLHPLKVKTGNNTHTNSNSNNNINHHNNQQFHRRATSAIPVPKPSHKPPSTFHSFRGDIQSQDIFVESLKKRNETIRILYPGADRFEMQRNDVWNHDSICTPSLILQPRSDREVSDCLKGYTAGVHKCLSANRRGAKFAIPRLCIAGGRNSFNSMREGSVVVDLWKLRSVKYDPKEQTVKVQGGARVIDVDSVLAEYGRMAVLGTSQHLGVVGCILAGGLGFASRKYGLACDNVVAASIILADGRLKKCTNNDDGQFKDILWSICGGGGGIGVIVSITLKCYPLRHAALLTYDMQTADIPQRRMAMRRWCNWICGDVDNDNHNAKDTTTNDDALVPGDPAANEIFSQITLMTDSNVVSLLASSIDTDAICQTDGFIEQYCQAEKRTRKKGFLKRIGAVADPAELPTGWQEIPSMAELISNKFGVGRKHVNFRMVRYADQLQSYSNEYFTPGNIFSSTKFAKSITNRILEVLVQATCTRGEISPKNESKIIIMAMSGCIPNANANANANTNTNSKEHHGKGKKKNTSFSARDMNYMIYIEGKWDAVAKHKIEKEKAKVKNWVHWIVKKLNLCEGVQSSAVPESMRDLVSKSGKSKPPSGWYNFSELSGRKLNQIKNQRDPRNVFSFASRVSWSRSLLSGRIDIDDMDDMDDVDVDVDDVDDTTISTDIQQVESVKDGEIQPTDCLTPQKNARPAGTPVLNQSVSSAGSEDADLDESGRDIELSISGANSQDDEFSVRSDVRRLLSITDSDEDLKDWSLAPVPLQRSDFNIGGNKQSLVSSPQSVEAELELEENTISL